MKHTTLDEEISLVSELARIRLQSFNPNEKHTREEQVFRALQTWEAGKSEWSEGSRPCVLERLHGSMKDNVSIPVTLTVAHGMRAPSPLKFGDPFGLPTYAWLHNLFALKILANKVQKIYPAGVCFWLFEEGFLFNDLLDVSNEVVKRNLQVFEVLAQRMEVPLRIVRLEKLHYQGIRFDEANSGNVLEDEIYAVLCSLRWMDDPRVMDALYNKGVNPYESIRVLVGENRWDEAARIAREKNNILSLRKKHAIFERIICETIGRDVRATMIDAALTFKKDRITIRPTGQALFNHGEAVLDRRGGRLSCHIVPHYRIRSEVHLGNTDRFVDPVCIDPREFGISGDSYIWKYECLP